MNEDQLKQIIEGLKAEIIPAVQETVEAKIKVVVNGKIDKLTLTVDENHKENTKRFNSQDIVLAGQNTVLEPWKKLGDTITNAVNFCKFIWPVVPVFGVLWGLLAWLH